MRKNGKIRFTLLYISYIYLIYNLVTNKLAYKKQQSQGKPNKKVNEQNCGYISTQSSSDFLFE